MSQLNILVLHKLAERHINTIKSAVPHSNIITCTIDEAQAHIGTADILLAWGASDIRPLFQKAQNLKWVSAFSAGVEKLVFPEITASSTILTNSRGIHAPVSEHVFAMILAFTRGLNIFIRQQMNKEWKYVPLEEIYDKTLGIVGLGSIGREIAKKAKGLGMRVIANKQTPTTELFVDQLYSPDQLDELLAASDFVVAALPLLPETTQLFNWDKFSVMKKSAYFINISRGGVVNEPDLCTALQQGLIKGAGLDVFEQEPLPSDSPLWDMPNVIITPHIAASSPLYMDRAVKLFTDNLSRFLQNKEMLNVVDKQKGY